LPNKFELKRQKQRNKLLGFINELGEFELNLHECFCENKPSLFKKISDGMKISTKEKALQSAFCNKTLLPIDLLASISEIVKAECCLIMRKTKDKLEDSHKGEHFEKESYNSERCSEVLPEIGLIETLNYEYFKQTKYPFLLDNYSKYEEFYTFLSIE
jgi:hypothetical protein